VELPPPPELLLEFSAGPALQAPVVRDQDYHHEERPGEKGQEVGHYFPRGLGAPWGALSGSQAFSPGQSTTTPTQRA
jgi:hypothetical protein